MKKCVNGHFYNPDKHQNCPYCPQPEGDKHLETKAFDSNKDDDKTEMLGDNQDTGFNSGNDDAKKTELFDKQKNNHNKTQIFDDDDSSDNKTDMFDKDKQSEPKSKEQNWNKTFIGIDPDDDDDANPNAEKAAPRSKRKLVGWLVSFTIDELGIDFRLYEGKNTIGSAPGNEITITGDKIVSSKHATVLFRKNKFRLKDEFSTNGTFLNGEDLDDEVLVLNDGDIIKVGDTLLKFRSAL